MEEQNITQAKAFIKKAIPSIQAKTAIVLGSGLGSFGETLQDSTLVSTVDIPHWPTSTVSGHQGKLVYGFLGKHPIFALQGRVHLYEGYSIQGVVFSVRVLHALGIQNLILTNAAGGLNPQFTPGDLMIITDHINLMYQNPLIGLENENLSNRFPDMSQAYDLEWIKIAENAAKDLQISVQQGVLAAGLGPSYETPAEIRMMQKVGGDAVCMSTVPEVIMGHSLGMRILGISCITNMAAGLSENRLSHEEVKETANKVQGKFIQLLTRIINQIHQ